MKKYKVRITGLGIEATAIIPFEIEPTIEQVENSSFFSEKKYTITYEEVSI